MAVDTTISGVSPAGTGYHNYPFAIVNESLLEYHYVGSVQPRVFELGTVADLNSRYVGVQFGAPVAKGGSYAHTVGAIVRA